MKVKLKFTKSEHHLYATDDNRMALCIPIASRVLLDDKEPDQFTLTCSDAWFRGSKQIALKYALAEWGDTRVHYWDELKQDWYALTDMTSDAVMELFTMYKNKQVGIFVRATYRSRK